MTTPNIDDLVGSVRRLGVTEPALREILCRRCGAWMTQQPDMTWRHTHDDTICCIDPITLEEVPDPRLTVAPPMMWPDATYGWAVHGDWTPGIGRDRH